MTGRADAIFAAPAVAAVFTERAQVQRMLDVEAALARAEADAGVIPAEAAETIAAQCTADAFDIDALFNAAMAAGTVVIPLVDRLTELVGREEAAWVHWGATSQDIIDTAAVLQAREALDLVTTDLMAVGQACVRLAERHATTPMAGRTLLQQAVPISFGLKAAHWLAATTRQLRRLHQVRKDLPLQFGGAAGTLASLGDAGLTIAASLGDELDLPVPDLPWHTDRAPLAELAASLAVTAGAMAKIATDVVLLTQTEVAEVAEAPRRGKGSSSAMPHKRNPVDAVMAIAAARLTLGTLPVLLSGMVAEHERAAGGWQAEWVALPQIVMATAGAVARVRALVEGLQVAPDRMRQNLERSGGQLQSEALVRSLAPVLGRQEAFAVVGEVSEQAAATGIDLRRAAGEDERVTGALDPAQLDRALDTAAALGNAETFVGRAVTAFRAVQDQP